MSTPTPEEIAGLARRLTPSLWAEVVDFIHVRERRMALDALSGGAPVLDAAGRQLSRGELLLMSAPLDDEPVGDEERAEIDAGRASFAQEGGIGADEIKRRWL